MHRFWSRKRRAAPNGHENGEVAFDPNAKPDFLCVGAPKAGTSWLFLQLTAHMDFWMPPLKEVSYFDNRSRSRRPDRVMRQNLSLRDERDAQFLEAMDDLCQQQHIDLNRYAQLFAPKGPLLSGDISPGYCIVPTEIITRILERFPDLKVIFMARDPVERAWSDLSMAVSVGNLPRFDTSNRDEVMRHLLHPDIVMRSFQSLSVERWQSHVPPEQFRLYFFDDLENDPAELRWSILNFLGANAEKSVVRARADRKVNETKGKLPLTEQARATVAHFFEQELESCATKLGGPAKSWPARYGLLSVLWFFQFVSDCDFFVDLLMFS